jgi:hypothetical protein
VWAVGCVVVYLGVFGIGGLVLGRYWEGGVAVIVAALLTMWLVSATDTREAAQPAEVRVV